MWLLNLILLFVLKSIHCDDSYECVEMVNVTRPQEFATLEAYRTSSVSFRTANNKVRFVSQIQRLQPNAFVTEESNYIRELYLDNIDLTVIDRGAFSQLYCVRILHLDHNKLFDISPETFTGLNKLQELNLNNNELSAIAGNTFEQVENLLKLDLSFNDIKQLSTDSLAKLDDLWELHLEHNSLVELPSDMFQAARRLRWLYLGDNRITVVTSPALRHLPHLDFLQLRNNGLAYVYAAVLADLPKLKRLDLSGNVLEKLDVRGIHDSLPMLRKLNIRDNAFQCHVLEPLLTDMERYNIGAVLSNNLTKYKDVHIYDIGCYNGTSPISSTAGPGTTSSPETTPGFPPNVDFTDMDRVLAGIESLRGLLVALLVIVLACTAVNVLYKSNVLGHIARRRPLLAFQDSSTETTELLNR